MITDSKEKMLDSKEIIETAMDETGSPLTHKQGVAAIAAESRTPYTITLREGNTIFLINFDPKDKTRGEFRPLNADIANNYITNIKQFLTAASMMGFRTLIATFKDASILTVIKRIERNPPFPSMKSPVKQLDKKTYQVTFELPGKKTVKGSAQ